MVSATGKHPRDSKRFFSLDVGTYVRIKNDPLSRQKRSSVLPATPVGGPALNKRPKNAGLRLRRQRRQ